MGKALIIFGSASDKRVYSVIEAGLKKAGVATEMQVCSVHRNGSQVSEIVDASDADIIIAGAGLSAALPGVIASRSLKPVIGVPVGAAYQGLDALLSISQMPKGYPVLCVGVDSAAMATANAVKILKSYRAVALIGDQNNEQLAAARKVIELFGIDHRFAYSPVPDAVNLAFVCFDEPLEKRDELIVYCPLLLQEDNAADAALSLLKHSDHGLWVGLNSGVNAALAAIEIINEQDMLTEQLVLYREQLKAGGKR
ncbi:TPA: AIR carboxylase family protein [Candidatus Woesearchaeota archaeon]|nr:AIR carboxylase family protein [Candidatus Woesearchaeota archaeon]HII69001.1 AIR carboxylase family protein [Candidatus Woesearchaeota archaeon]